MCLLKEIFMFIEANICVFIEANIYVFIEAASQFMFSCVSPVLLSGSAKYRARSFRVACRE
jgi:hypothetical protein